MTRTNNAGSAESAAPSANHQLVLGTISMAVCFASWGLIGPFASRFKELFHLTASQTAFLVATPVLLGALARLPMGLLTDRYRGRVVFSALMLFAAIPPFLIPEATSYSMLLAIAFLLGVAGSSFAVGVGFVSPFFPREKQGSALGVYGLGNVGQSLAAFGGPALALIIGWQNVFRGVGAMLVIWAVAFAVFGRNAGVERTQPKSLGSMLSLLKRQPLVWVLASFYFLTFGGFVAFSIYLTSLLRDQFKLTAADAGLRTAGFVVLATFLRPVGGWLADKIGGARVLSLVFMGVVPFALLLGWQAMLPFTVGALGCAALLGTGNGAVFKLVPQYFGADTGTATGLVSAMGGLGGFFPPLLLGFFLDKFGVVWPGFVLLALTAAVLWLVNAKVFIPRENVQAINLNIEGPLAEQIRSGAFATLWTGLLVAAIVVGSRNLGNFDAALVMYTFAIIFATWGVVFHYNVWLMKPPTRVYWDRGWEIFRQQSLWKSLPTLVRTTVTHLLGQTFIRKRSPLRWWMHQCIFWGCISAMGITFPLAFGWIGFRSSPDNQMIYTTYLFGFPAGSFPLHSFIAGVLFHALDISAVLVLVGVGLSLWRRMRDRGAQSIQSFAQDMFPLFLLFAISVTGLALTASQEWGRGEAYSFMAILHAVTVIGALLFLPFGKFFHIFQRPAQLGVKLYHETGDAGEPALCGLCGHRYASLQHIEDLRHRVLPKLGFDYTIAGPAGHWQALCPSCKRRALASAQVRLRQVKT
jgi:NNP family nitrate/nitrite transporter-like MFS transporter